MAITKIHPIKSTLHLAIDYIVNGDKTDAINPIRKAIIRSVTRVISCAKKITFPSLMSISKAIRKNIGQTVSLGMKMSKQKEVLLGRVGFNLTLTEL